ncbi:MAG: 3-dehydroquinate synthase II [Candidatus Bathyarchaeia archaeon]
MKELWVEVSSSLPEPLRGAVLKAAHEVSGTVLVGEDLFKSAKDLGLRVVSKAGGEIQLLERVDETHTMVGKKALPLTCIRVSVRGKGDEADVVKAAEEGVDYIIISCPDWKVIPLENLIAKIHGRSKLLAEVSSASEAKVALETLELGADGVVLKTADPKEVYAVGTLMAEMKLSGEGAKLQLIPAKILQVKQLGLGARVCVDTCELMQPGEGMLLGCQSSGLFLVQAEVQENPHVEPRPFRVNAGPVSLYTLSPSGQTRYLSELKAGDEVLISDREGNTRPAVVGRIKIERRPMILVEAEAEGKRFKTIVQNAETIRLVTADGSISVSELKAGNEVLIYHKPGGRHFGVLVREETVIER